MIRCSTCLTESPRAPARRACALGLFIALLAGCGSSDHASQLPESAKKSLWQKKADVQPRPAPRKSARR